MKEPPKISAEPQPHAAARPAVLQSSWWHELGRYFSIYGMLWRNSVVREMGFKVNFIMWIIVELLWFALQLAFMAVIYQHTSSIGTWTQWEVVLLQSTSHLIQHLFTALFLTNLTQLSELIRTGKLDFMLLLPVNTRFLVSFRQVDLGGFVNAAAAVAVMIYAGHRLSLHPTAVQLTAFDVFHSSEVPPPDTTWLGLATKVTFGTVALPPGRGTIPQVPPSE